MLGSGTEGVMAAIRAARAFTGKKRVIKVGGAYHGWSDQMVYSLHIPGTRRMEATGIPRGASGAPKSSTRMTWMRCGAGCGTIACAAARRP